ncbi:hypothetical protein [Frigidibacter sp. SD6-1]|uniref:hypothetical protein n=1 Tax=Frigidibacter sp. SD6-1 TaxID=3032581 RepID=UPI0024DF61A9|nr:hypothetical protein [Frigidibacter sp. SD6-1]
MPPTGSKSDKTQPVKRRCNRCHGFGRAPCRICAGKGQVLMGTDVYGRAKFERCGGCFGTKTTRCATCGGDGFVT